MKKLITLAGFGLLWAAQSSFAATPTVSQAVIVDTVDKIGTLMKTHYVFPDRADETAKFLNKKLANGEFNQFTDSKALAQAITDALREVTKDKHLRVRPARSGGKHHTQKDEIRVQLDRAEHSRYKNNGINQVRKLEGNVGYLDLSGFHQLADAKKAIDAAMLLLATSDAIIIDVRKNGGGSPETVQYLCSYFFDNKLLLNSLYWRKGNRTDEFWTLEKVGGNKMPDTPLLVLTSDRTFSAAEEFSYNLKTRERATLVGETTGGGANPGGSFRVNDYFGIFIATGKAINPITGTNWEGTGVTPDVEIAADQAFDKALIIAAEHAEKQRKTKRQQYRTAMNDMISMLENLGQSHSVDNIAKQQTSLFEKMTSFQQQLSLSERQINDLGYRYLLQKKLPSAAIFLMQFNANQHPNSANAFDSLGEAWLTIDKPQKAKESFLTGLSLVDKQDQRTRNILEQNLTKANQQLNKS